MARIETWFDQDLNNTVKVRYINGNLFSQDNAGNLIGVRLSRNGEQYSGGGTVSANVIRSDGVTVSVPGALSGNLATVVLPQAAYAVLGAVTIIVKLTVSGTITTITAAIANVYQSSTDTIVDPGTIIPSIETLIAEIDAAVASIPADYSSLWTSLAPAFSTSTSYVSGQYVTYNGGLYRFVADHSGSWNSAHVVSVNFGGEIYDLSGELTGVKGDFDAFVDATGKVVKNSAYGQYTRTHFPIENGSYYAIKNESDGDMEVWTYDFTQSKNVESIGTVSSDGTVLFKATKDAEGIRYYANSQNGGYGVVRKIDDIQDNTSVNNDIDAVAGKKVGIDLGNWIRGEYISNSDGSAISSTNWQRTDFIPLDYSGVALYIYDSSNTNENTYNALYDENKDYISNIRLMPNGGYNHFYIPPEAKYMRLSVHTNETINVDVFAISSNLADASGNPETLFPARLDGYIDPSNGDVIESDSWYYIDYVDVRKYAYIRIQQDNIYAGTSVGNLTYNAFYDQSKNFISKFTISDRVDIPYGVAYIRLSMNKNTLLTIKGYEIGREIWDAISFANDMMVIPITGKTSGYFGTVSRMMEPGTYKIVNNTAGGINISLLNTTTEESTGFGDVASGDTKQINILHSFNKAYFYSNLTSGVPGTVYISRIYSDSENGDKLPDYYKTHVALKNDEVNVAMDNINNCVSFAFFTDLHISSNSLSSGPIIRNILEETSVKNVVCCGDVISAYGGEARVIQDCETYKKVYGDIVSYFVRGNHDNYAKETESATTGYIAPNSQVVNRFFRPMVGDGVIRNDDKTYYYCDKPDNKMRFIFIDTTEVITANTSGANWQPAYAITQAQVNWFIDLLNNTPSGYKIVLFNHIPINNNLDWYSDFCLIFGDIVEAFNAKTTINKTNAQGIVASANFANANGKVLLSICGHGHTDDWYESPTGCVYYEVNCDAAINNGGSPYTRTTGTVSEQALDVVIINMETEEINCIRYGAGEDKTFNA